MKLADAVLMLFFLTVTISAQYVQVYPVVGTRFALQGYSVPGLFNSASNIGTINPASLSEFTNLSAGLSYKYASQVNDVYLTGDNGKRIYGFLPGSVGIVFPSGNFRFGLALGQKYNLSVETAPIDVTTIDHPDGTGETFTSKNERSVYDYSVLSSFMLNNVISENTLSFGVKLSLSRLDFLDALWDMEAKTTAYGFGFTFGLDYKIILSNNNSICLGTSFDKGVKFEKNFNVSGSRLNVINIGEGSVGRLTDNSFLLTGNTPDVLKVEAALNVIPRLKLYESFANVYWHEVSAGYRNQIEFNSRAVYSPNDTFDYALGVFSTDRRSIYIWENVDNRAIYLSAGMFANIANCNIGLIVSDSHLFSADSRKQTIAELSFGYNFK